jgi:hypothetical protein
VGDGRQQKVPLSLLIFNRLSFLLPGFNGFVWPFSFDMTEHTCVDIRDGCMVDDVDVLSGFVDVCGFMNGVVADLCSGAVADVRSCFNMEDGTVMVVGELDGVVFKHTGR